MVTEGFSNLQDPIGERNKRDGGKEKRKGRKRETERVKRRVSLRGGDEKREEKMTSV